MQIPHTNADAASRLRQRPAVLAQDEALLSQPASGIGIRHTSARSSEQREGRRARRWRTRRAAAQAHDQRVHAARERDQPRVLGALAPRRQPGDREPHDDQRNTLLGKRGE